MRRLALRRLLILPVILWAVATTVWLLMIALPGDPVRLLAGQSAQPEIVARVRADWGFDDPLPVQYARFLGRLVRLDLGYSYLQDRPVSAILLGHLPATLALGLTAMALALGAGIGLGLLAALRRGTPVDTALLVGTLAGVSVPVFWLGLVLILIFASSHGLGWLPVSGYGDGPKLTPWPGGPLVRLPHPAHLVLPAVTLALVSAGGLARLTRSALLDVLGQDYMRAARARGLPPMRLFGRHALRTALAPVVTYAGLDLAALLGGAIATEYVFAWPGLGKVLVRAIHARDLPVVEGSVLLLTCAFVSVGSLTDLLHAWLLPAAREQA